MRARGTIAAILGCAGAWLLLGVTTIAGGQEPEPSPTPACETGCVPAGEPVVGEDPDPADAESSQDEPRASEHDEAGAAATAPELSTAEPTVASGGNDPGAEQSAAGQRATVSSASADAAVSIVDNAYQPPSVTITEGDSVTWTHAGSAPHTVTGDGFDSGTMSSGDTFGHTFDSAGTFSYICQVHGSSMSGEVVVEAAGGADEGGTDGGEVDDGDTEGVGDTAIPDQGLPATGAGTGTVGLAGALLMVAGATLWRSSRSRSD